MRVLEFELKGKEEQYRRIDNVIRTAQFVRNKSLRYWMDNRGIGKVALGTLKQRWLYRHNTSIF
ncbi:MAG: hypothetical protein RLZZ490_959 [Cyanobacteriota bacterium]